MGGGLVGSPPLEKKSDFLIFSAQNALFQLKWQKNLEYIFICFANKGGGDIPLFGAEWGVSGQTFEMMLYVNNTVLACKAKRQCMLTAFWLWRAM